jgi:hypothetical protein
MSRHGHGGLAHHAAGRGADLPEISFGIAPLVFVAVHVFTLIRYHLLAVNLRSFRSELDATVPLAADRERCRQLLSHVEFVVALAVPSDSSRYSRLFHWVARAMIIAVFPVVVLLAMNISSLRYQNVWLNQAQHTALLIDLLMLVWFFSAERRSSGLAARVGWQRLALWGQPLQAMGLVVVMVMVVDALWLNATSAPVLPAPGSPTTRRLPPPIATLSDGRQSRVSGIPLPMGRRV